MPYTKELNRIDIEDASELRPGDILGEGAKAITLGEHAEGGWQALQGSPAILGWVSNDLVEGFLLANGKVFRYKEGYDSLDTDSPAFCNKMLYSVGATPLDAIKALAAWNEWGEVDEASIRELGEGNPALDWGYGFSAGETGFKAAGAFVPGGAILTWWK